MTRLVLLLALAACTPQPQRVELKWTQPTVECPDPNRPFACYRAELEKHYPNRVVLCRSDPEMCHELPTLRERMERR